MYPEVDNFEVMPWPNRVFFGKYEIEGVSEKQTIPKSYATEVMTLVNTLNNMPKSTNKISGSHGIGVVHSNSMMFQKELENHIYNDPWLSNFYGMVLPLLKRGVPVELIHLEHIGLKETLKNIKVLVMSYANYKPLQVEYHKSIADWVKNGGILIYCGRDNDPYQKVKEWWNSGDYKYKTPSIHLFEQLGIENREGLQNTGNGKSIIYRTDPKEIILKTGYENEYVSIIEEQYNSVSKDNLKFNNYLQLERGVYDIIAVLDESVNSESRIIKSSVIDLFNPELPVLKIKEVKPGNVALLYNLNRTDFQYPEFLCGSGRVYNEKKEKKSYNMIIKGPLNTTNISRIWLPGKPESISAKDKDNYLQKVDYEWDIESKTLRIKFDNHPDGINFNINFLNNT
jgi:hypothetical protein